ncbi:MAG: GPW/gp25 family protein [Nakamurella sp.]
MAADPGIDFVGAGWAFPLATDATGGVALVVRDREIAQAIRLILATSPGERPMRPDFGCRVHDHVFSAMNAATAGAVAYDVRSALERWEPRIEVTDVVVSFDSHDVGTMFIDVRYVIRGDNDQRNLVFPFYVIPDEPEQLSAAPGPGSTPAAPRAALERNH